MDLGICLILKEDLFHFLFQRNMDSVFSSRLYFASLILSGFFDTSLAIAESITLILRLANNRIWF